MCTFSLRKYLHKSNLKSSRRPHIQEYLYDIKWSWVFKKIRHKHCWVQNWIDLGKVGEREWIWSNYNVWNSQKKTIVCLNNHTKYNEVTLLLYV